MVETLDLLLKAFDVGLQSYDKFQETKYHQQYSDLVTAIRKEEAKHVYGDLEPLSLRDQGKIDNAHLALMLLLREFLRNEQPK